MLLLRGQATPSLASPSAAKQGRSPSGLPPPLSFSYPCEALSLKVLRLWGGGVGIQRRGDKLLWRSRPRPEGLSKRGAGWA